MSPSWFNSLVWQAPSWTMWCWQISSASVLNWDQFRATEDGRKYSMIFKRSSSFASSFQGSTQWFSSSLGSPGGGNFPGLRVGHWAEVMVCVGGRSVISCHHHAWSVEKRWTQRCAQLTFMAPPLTKLQSYSAHLQRENVSFPFFVQHLRFMKQSGSTSFTCFWVRHRGSSTAG